MRFAPTEDQIEFRSAVRSLLADVCTPTDVRSAWGGSVGTHTGVGNGDGRVPAAWKALGEMGVLGLMVPEEHGGLGMGDDDLVGIAQECGFAGLPDPVGDTAGVAAAALTAAAVTGSGGDLAASWLPRIASGDASVVVGFGEAPLVAAASTADAFLLCADLPTSDGTVSSALHLVDATEVQLEPVDSVDGSRSLARLRWQPGDATVLAGPDDANTLAATAFDRSATLDAALLVGLSRRMLEMTIEYVGERKQFGVPIGTFQAVKHHLADASLGVEFAEPLVTRAAHALALGEPSAVHASMAKSRAALAALAVSETTLQCHGAIGYTVEHDLHLYMKRSWALARRHGDAAWHRARVRAHLLAA